MGKNITNKKEKKKKYMSIKDSDKMIYYIRIPDSYTRKGCLVDYALQSKQYGDMTVWATGSDNIEINAQSETVLTRLLGCKPGIVNTEMIVVEYQQTKKKENIKEQEERFRQLIKTGFYWRNEHYIFFGAGAGQMRTKRSVFVNEKKYRAIEETIMCGITMDDVNRIIGYKNGKPKYICSPTRFLSYKSLNNSNTVPWNTFDIDKAIVVDDWEQVIQYDCRFVDCTDYNSYNDDNVGLMDIEIPHTDGWGMKLPMSGDDRHAFSFRAPWFKGLITDFDFVRFIQLHDCSPVVKDVWGNEHNIIVEDIRYIFTASQFKLWKAYKDWDDYKEKFKRLGCEFGICVEEIHTDKKSEINYQMLQTLDFTHEEVEELLKKDIDKVKDWVTNESSARKLIGADLSPEEWMDANYWQKMLDLCPEMINIPYCTVQIKKIANDRISKIKGGRITTNGQYHFIAPDAYAFCEWLFLGEENPVGLLPSGYCFNKEYKKGETLDLLRAPHLYREHCLRINVDNELFDECDEWFGSCSAVYTSIHDDSTKVLNNDVDGDKSLVLPEDDIITKRAIIDMKNIHSLKYEIRSGEKCEVTIDGIIDGMMTTYGDIANIGTPSNQITKIWDSDLTEEEKLKLVAFTVQVVNNRIDYAKSSDMTFCNMCEEAEEVISPIVGGKFPCFFWRLNKASKRGCKSEPKTAKEAKTTMQKIVYQTNAMTKDVKVIKNLYEKNRIYRSGKLQFGQREFDYRWLLDQDIDKRVADAIEFYSNNIYNSYSFYTQAVSKNPKLKHRINFGLLQLKQSEIEIKFGGKREEIRQKLFECIPENYSEEDKENIVYNALIEKLFNDNTYRMSNINSSGRIALFVLCFGDHAYYTLFDNYGKMKKKEIQHGVFECSDGTAFNTAKEAAEYAGCCVSDVYNSCEGRIRNIAFKGDNMITVGFTQTMRAKHKPHKPHNDMMIVCNETGEVFRAAIDVANAFDTTEQKIKNILSGRTKCLKHEGNKYTFVRQAI